MLKTKSPFASRFSPDVTSIVSEKSLKNRLKLNSLFNTRLKTEFRSSTYFLHLRDREWFSTYQQHLFVGPNSFLMVVCYDQLNPTHIFSFTENVAISRPFSPCVSGDPMAHVCPLWNYYWILRGGTWSCIKLRDNSFDVSTACFFMFNMITVFSIQI
jgi:hypothetical protein